jgi:hypothetical protein
MLPRQDLGVRAGGERRGEVPSHRPYQRMMALLPLPKKDTHGSNELREKEVE